MKPVRPAWVVLMVASAVTFVFSFTDFYLVGDGFASESVSAWGKGLFPLATMVPLLGLVAGALAAIRAFGNVTPPTILTFTPRQQSLVVTLPALLIMIGFLIVDGPPKGSGFWFLFMGSIGLVAGAVMDAVDTTVPAPAASAGTYFGSVPGAPAPPPIPPAPPSYGPPQSVQPPPQPPVYGPPVPGDPDSYPPGFGPPR